MDAPTPVIGQDNHPKGPNFLLIVILFGVAIIVVFIVAYVVLAGGGRHLVPGKHAPHPTSELVIPATKPAAKVPGMATQEAAESPFTLLQQKLQTGV